MEGLFQNTKHFNKRIAFITDKNKKISYKEIYKKSKEIASKIKQKSVTIIIAKNHYECFIGYIALIMFERTTILLDENFSLKFLQDLIKKYRVNYIFASNEYQSKIKNIDIIHEGDEYSIFKTNFDLHKKINKKNLLLLTTSGSTQNPKLVRLSKDNLLNNTINIIKYLNINKNHTTITTMPLAYSYGLSIFNTHFHTGSKIIINDNTIFDKNFWKMIKKNKVNSFGGVPQFYENLKRLDLKNLSLKSIKYLSQAGGKMDDETLKYYGNICKQKKIKFFVMYGQTEASPRMSYLEWKKFYPKLGSIGKPLDGCKFQIFREDRKIIKKSYVKGELVFFGRNVSLGYSKNYKDLCKGDLNKGKLYTGDIGYKDNENYYFLSARKNRISKIFGLRINLDDIENFLKKFKINSKCLISNKKLKILIKNNYSRKKIKFKISNFSGINENYIQITKVKKYPRQSVFK